MGPNIFSMQTGSQNCQLPRGCGRICLDWVSKYTRLSGQPNQAPDEQHISFWMVPGNFGSQMGIQISSGSKLAPRHLPSFWRVAEKLIVRRIHDINQLDEHWWHKHLSAAGDEHMGWAAQFVHDALFESTPRKYSARRVTQKRVPVENFRSHEERRVQRKVLSRKPDEVEDTSQYMYYSVCDE